MRNNIRFKDIEKEPFKILESLSVKEIVAIIKEANQGYQNGKSVLSDDTYEIIRQYLKKLLPDHPILDENKVGAPVAGRNKVKLPIYMGSQNKIKDDKGALERWVKRYNKPAKYTVSDKLDGISALLFVDGKDILLYSRGDGVHGQNISHLLKYIPNLPTKKLYSGLLVRGELVINKKDWEKIKVADDRSSARNTVAGAANSKKPDPEIASHIKFVAYELLGQSKTHTDAIQVLKEMGFEVVYREDVKTVTTEHLSNILMKRRRDSVYEIDGIVVRHDKYYDITDGENPDYSFAFKSVMAMDKVEVVVKNVIWNVSKNGLLKPVVVFDTIFLSGAHIQRATAHNADNVIKNKIGPGSHIIVTRSGDVIPYILEVLTPSSAGEASLPDPIEYPWTLQGKEALLKNPEYAKEYQIRNLENYVDVLGVKGLGPKSIRRMYNNGIDSVKKLVNITKADLYKGTLSAEITIKIYRQLQSIYAKSTCIDFMVASNIFGAGVGKRKLRFIIDNFEEIIEGKTPTLQDLLSVKGVGEKFARKLLDHIDEFRDFMKEVGLPCRTSKVVIEETPDGFMNLNSKQIVFTGFRNPKLETFVLKRGGKVSSYVSLSTSIVVARLVEDSSIKSETAKELGIPIMTAKQFMEEIGFIDVDEKNANFDYDKELDALRNEIDLDEENEDESDEEATNDLSQRAECIRQVMNWSNMKHSHIFGKTNFDKDVVREELAKNSPKLERILEHIRELDERDMKKHKKVFKHMIFSDVTKRGFGAKIVAAGLTAYGWKHAYDNNFIIKTGVNHFAVLASTQLYSKPITVDFKKQLLTKFNKRPDNIHGDNVRIMVLDSGYKEGIDLFDVKYVHLFEPTLTYADQMQAIGRATRLCGQKGLDFQDKVGWSLEVFRYEHVDPVTNKTSFELIEEESSLDSRYINLTMDMERICMENSVDQQFTQNMHKGGANNNLEKYKWAKIEKKNGCANAANNAKFDYTPSQKFIRDYFQPDANIKGLFLWHSLGSGKTCTAISCASHSWEAEGYTIMWVTRGTLRSDVYKNMFEQSCIDRIRDMDPHDIPDELPKRRKLLSKSWLPPISFRQFTNMLQRKNSLYNFLLKRNGFSDPLKRTLIIIDEAHLMLSPTMKDREKPDVNLLQSWINNSQKTSGKDSVRLLLMSATPITDTPFNYIRLLNLTANKDKEQLPEEATEFTKKFLNPDTLLFTKSGETAFGNVITKRVSYLNRMRDVSQFAQPVIKDIKVNISLRPDFTEAENKIEANKTLISVLKENKIGALKKKKEEELDIIYEQKQKTCKSTDKECLKKVKEWYKIEKSLIDEQVREEKTKSKTRIDELTSENSELKNNMKSMKRDDTSVATMLAKKCFKEENKKKDPTAK